MPAAKPQERAAARRLRAERGMSVKAIARQLDVSVASVSAWVRDVQLTEQQRRVLLTRPRQPSIRCGRARAARSDAQLAGRVIARAGDRLHQFGCMLYWAEGSKRRNSVMLTNSDPDMLKLFVRFLRECYAVDPADIKLSVAAYSGNGLALEAIETHWRETLQLPLSAMRAGRLFPGHADEVKRRKLIYGTARVSVHSTAIVQSIYGAIQEYGGFERPEWLD